MNERHNDAIHNEARGRLVGLANSYGKTDRSILLRETFSAHLGEGGGGFTQERFSNLGNNQFFQAKKLTEKNLSARKNIIGNITLSKPSRLTWLGVGNYIPDLPIGTIRILKL